MHFNLTSLFLHLNLLSLMSKVLISNDASRSTLFALSHHIHETQQQYQHYQQYILKTGVFFQFGDSFCPWNICGLGLYSQFTVVKPLEMISFSVVVSPTQFLVVFFSFDLLGLLLKNNFVL